MSAVAEIAEVRWGYTMDDIDRLTRRVFNKTRRNYLFDHVDHLGAAWFGITEHLFDSGARPTEFDLIAAGVQRVGDESRANRSFYGIREDMKDTRAPSPDWVTPPAPRFAAFWRREGHDDFTDVIAEREALPRVLSVLNADLYEAIVTLAAYGNMSEAAKAVGMEYRPFNKRVDRARKKIIEAWFAPEHPVQKSNGFGDTCRSGHSRAEHSYRNEAGRNVCRVCNRAAQRRWAARQQRGGQVVLED